jgi:hypothetical protein
VNGDTDGLSTLIERVGQLRPVCDPKSGQRIGKLTMGSPAGPVVGPALQQPRSGRYQRHTTRWIRPDEKPVGDVRRRYTVGPDFPTTHFPAAHKGV